VESIESPRDHPFDYTGIYSQAYALYQQGFRYWFSREEILKLQEHNKKFEASRLEQELIDIYFRKPVGNEPGEFMPVARALQIVGGGITQKLSAFSLGRAFTELNFEKVVRNHMRGYIIVQRSAEEIKARQRMLGTDVTDGTEVF
jgi:predicted P-loop ATPase